MLVRNHQRNTLTKLLEARQKFAYSKTNKADEVSERPN